MSKKISFLPFVTLVTILIFPAFGFNAIPPTANSSVQLLLGNPSNASGSINSPNNFLVLRSQYAMSYNKGKGGPNWVSWHLASSDLGNSGRCNCFAPDSLLPSTGRIRPNDYQGSGYDRGHLCPSGDRTNNRANNAATNMLPQTAELNRHVWEKLETYCRGLVEEGDELYIIAGGRGEAERIANGKINVPTHCWNIVVVITKGNNDLARINEKTRVIAVDMPNEENIEDHPWRQYITSVNELETKTGYHFFTSLPLNVQSALKAKQDGGRRANANR